MCGIEKVWFGLQRSKLDQRFEGIGEAADKFSWNHIAFCKTYPVE